MIGTLAKILNIHIPVSYIPRRKNNELSEVKEQWIENFLERSGITYSTLRRRDIVYVGMDGDKR